MSLKKLFLKNLSGGNYNMSDTKINMIILLLILLIVITIYVLKNSNVFQQTQTDAPQLPINPSSPLPIPPSPISPPNRPPPPPENVPVVDPVGPAVYDVLRKYDYRTLNDPLTPPYKRDDYMIPAYIADPNNFGIYTQGGPAPFMKMGYLNHHHSKPGEPYKFLTLMGRPRYYGSSRYDYYVTSNFKDENLKIDLDQYKYRNELYTGDTVYIPQLKREYEVHIDRILDYTYNPYII
jgi:hypothetical protein